MDTEKERCSGLREHRPLNHDEWVKFRGAIYAGHSSERERIYWDGIKKPGRDCMDEVSYLIRMEAQPISWANNDYKCAQHSPWFRPTISETGNTTPGASRLHSLPGSQTCSPPMEPGVADSPSIPHLRHVAHQMLSLPWSTPFNPTHTSS